MSDWIFDLQARLATLRLKAEKPSMLSYSILVAAADAARLHLDDHSEWVVAITGMPGYTLIIHHTPEQTVEYTVDPECFECMSEDYPGIHILKDREGCGDSEGCGEGDLTLCPACASTQASPAHH